MRPQRFSCGISATAMARRASRSYFNEAAAFQLRNPCNSWSRRSGVEHRFNEAAAFQLRNLLIAGVVGMIELKLQ